MPVEFMDHEHRRPPFPMTTPPVRIGWYRVETAFGYVYYWWNGHEWIVARHPLYHMLGEVLGGKCWYGQSAPEIEQSIFDEEDVI